MPDPIRRLTVDQFVALVEATRAPDSLSRKITHVHVHHTWRPRRQDFRGLATVEAMRRVHMEVNGWSDIAQHLTIDPQGVTWTGRNWNMPPASQSGRNGTAAAGPFMIEMVGDFDTGRDPFDGAQRQAAIDVVAALLRRFGLDPSAINFHRELGSPKTCPGTGIDKAAFIRDVQKALTASAPRGARAKGAAPLFAIEQLAGHEVTRAMPAGAPVNPTEAEVPEGDEGTATLIARMTQDSVARAQVRRGGLSPALAPAARATAEWSMLIPHVVNLTKGQLSATGEFEMRPENLDTIAEGIRRFVAGRSSPQLMIHAHGGLVNERSALAYARDIHKWWLGHGVYPVFIVWETSVLELLRQKMFGARAVSDAGDRILETTVGPIGREVWNDIKESARLAAAPDAGDGVPGGGLLFARRLGALMRDLDAAGKTPGVHAVGHSAGAIFHAHLLPLMIADQIRIETLSVLAPAIRVDAFKQRLVPHLRGTSPAIGKLSMFTMNEEAELADDVFKIYRKSLLYFVSRGFEAKRKTPILGLEESVRDDAEMKALFGLGAAKAGLAELQFSRPKGETPNPLTRSLTHGGFDNDASTMSSVLRRIVGAADSTGLGEADFPIEVASRSIALEPPPPAGPTVGAGGAPAIPGPRAGGRKLALCVGINTYPDRPLAACVADAEAWGGALTRAGFSVQSIFDGRATRAAILDTVGSLVAGAAPGDVIVLQCAGHGTQLENLTGTESDGFDEAFVPVDYRDGRFLLDDDLADVWSRIPHGALVTLFMDCCHSGTLSRFAPSIRPRALDGSRTRFLPVSPEQQAAHRAFRSQMPARASRALVEESPAGVVHFAACQDNEFAFEAGGHGDFTRAAVAKFADALSRGDTNEAFLDAIRRELAAADRQHPMLMKLPSDLVGRPMLAPRTAPAPAASAPSSGRPGSESFEAEVRARLDTIETLLRQRGLR